MTSPFDNYLSTHFANVGGAQGQTHRAEALRANYLALFQALDPDATVLEIGPGNGELLGIMRAEARLRNVTAIDLSPQVVELCNAQRGGGVVLVQDTRDFLEQHRSSFDLIILLHVLEHVPKDQTIGLLEAIREALRPGGRVVIEVPNMGNPIIGLTSRYADFTHEAGFTEASLSQVLRMASFGELRILPFRIPRSSAARFVQWMLRGVLEALVKLVTLLYTANPELNSANIVAVAQRSSVR